MDLRLTDEQRWLSESIETLLAREWPAPEDVAAASPDRRRRVWDELVAFGALSIGDRDGIGAVEACLISRALGAHLCAVPFLGSAASRLALAPFGDEAPSERSGDSSVALALLEPGTGWAAESTATALDRDFALTGEKVAVEQTDLSERLLVSAALGGEIALALVPAGAAGVAIEPRDSFNATLPFAAVAFDHTRLRADAVLAGPLARSAIARLTSAGALLAAAEAIGAADRALDDARRYAGERRQFGRPIGSFQSLRHILADMYVRSASGWSAVLYAAAAFDEGAGEAPLAAAVAKAYVSRRAREIAHGALQVFGGIAFTDEHPAHRYLRRIVVREQQFGDAAHHERAIGLSLARRGAAALTETAELTRA